MFVNPSAKLKNAAACIFAIHLLLIVIVLVFSIINGAYIIGSISVSIMFLLAWYNAILHLTLCDSADQAQQAAYQAGECVKYLNQVLRTIEETDIEQMPTWKKVEMKGR